MLQGRTDIYRFAREIKGKTGYKVVKTTKSYMKYTFSFKNKTLDPSGKSNNGIQDN